MITKQKKKKITPTKYNKLMDKIIKKGLSPSDTLIAMLDEASKYDLIDNKKRTK